jgi:hypothetical protein
MRRSILAAAFAAAITAGVCTAANAVPAGAGLLAAKANDANVTQVYWRGRGWGWRGRGWGWRGRGWGFRPRVYGFYGWRRWHRPRVYGYGWRRWHRPAYGYYGWRRPAYGFLYSPRVFGWSGYRGCWW